MSSSERPVNSASSPLHEGPKRKRGRPKKQPRQEAVGPLPVKKPRGRPKGSKKVNSGSQVVEPSAGKRTRGQPRKWSPPATRERARREGSAAGSAGWSVAAPGVAGKDGSRLSTTLRRSLSNVPAAAQ